MDTLNQKFKTDLKTLLEDTEQILQATTGQADAKMMALRRKLSESFNSVQSTFTEWEKALVDRTKAAAKATDHYVHEHPWQSIGIASGIGLLIGILIGRR